jgi:hypothetical protein
MFLGFYIGTKHNGHRIKVSFSDDPSPKVKNAVIIVSIIILINFFNLLDKETFGRLVGYAQSIFFNQKIILLFTLSMVIYHWDKLTKIVRTLFTSIFLCVVILSTLSGSRSGLLVMGILVLFGILAVKQKVLISKRLILLFLIAIPVSLLFFVGATYKQELQIKESVTTKHLYMAYDRGVFNWSKIKEQYLGKLFFRVGFLDFPTEIIANWQRYSGILNGEYYSKSIIDNVLTPGLDIFGVPRVSHSLSYVRIGKPPPSIEQINKAYQSDQLGIYGEFYGLFYGYPALFVLFFLAFIFQKAFDAYKTRNILLSILYNSVILNLFYELLNSYGLDWFLLYSMISAIITSLLFARFYVGFGTKKFVIRFESKSNGEAFVSDGA